MNRYRLRALLMASMTCMPTLLAAQVSSYIPTDSISPLAEWLIALAILLVLVLGVMAKARRISWAWCIGAIFGLAVAFGAPQVLHWFQATFGG